MPPTILQIIPQLDTGGAELSAVEITAAVVAAGGRAIVLSEGGRLVADIAAAGGEHVMFPAASKNPVTMLANARRLERLFAAESIDIVHARSRAPAWSALLAARRAEIPFVTTYHGAYNETGPLKKLYNSVMARGDLVIANSAYTAGLIKSRYGTPDDRLRIIHRGVDGGHFDPAIVAPQRVSALRASWGVPEHAPVVLQAARLTGWKGQRVLIEAARILAATGRLHDAHIVLAGDDQGRTSYAQTLRADIARAGLADRIHLVGHVVDMAAAFATAHLAIVGSTEPEAFGRAATEAQVMSCPVIATRIGAPPETVLAPPDHDETTNTGWLVPPGDAAALAEAMARALARSGQDRAALGARARAHVLAKFSLHVMKSKTLAVYDELIGTKLVSGFLCATDGKRAVHEKAENFFQA
ncbi:MAG: glycosyltransferase family 4 protein [Hyphomicrobiaceae bacterium]|nr:glycosyltransferase family 4 protein [Hyphomicrobiaceae bacterium]